MRVPDATVQDHADLLALLRLALGTGGADALSTTPDWPALLRQAAGHKLTAFLYPAVRTLPEHARTAPPPAVDTAWERVFLAESLRNEALLRQAAGVLRAGEAEDLPIMVLKGLWLAEHAYASPGQRPMVDIDLLVKETDFAQANGLLTDAGYQPLDRGLDPRFTHHREYIAPDAVAPIELHWDVTQDSHDVRARLDLESFWQNARPALVHGAPAWIPAPDDYILHLTLHWFTHRLGLGLGALVDLALCLGPAAPDWTPDHLNARACEWGLERPLGVVASLLRDALALPLPPLGVAPPDGIRREALNAVVGQYLCLPRHTTAFSHLLQTPGLLPKLRFCWDRLFLPRAQVHAENAGIRSSAGLARAYARRAGYLFRRYPAMLWRLRRGDPAVSLDVTVNAEIENVVGWMNATDGVRRP